MPERFYAFRLAPARTALGEAWPAAQAVLPPGTDVVCCRLQLPPALHAVLEADDRVWREVLAHLVLSAAERGTWQSLNAAESRRTEWLMGRVVAKDAVRGLLDRRGVPGVYPADVDVHVNGDGRPHPRGPWESRITGAPRLSLAHSADVAVAVAADATTVTAVGIDVERVRPLDDGFETLAFAEEERVTLAAAPAPQRAEWVLRFWCAKEAAAKAAGRGMDGVPQRWVVQRVDWQSGAVHVRMPVSPAAASGEHDTINAYTGRDGDLIFAVALRRGGES
jgi:4'-phosphopantetheinyl transferase EntD